MKRINLWALVAISIVISGCDNQAKQSEIEKQRQEDSIRVAENVKKELAEKEAKEKAERERKEAEERAAREATERESKTWSGASSIEELRNKLDGTTWTTDPDAQYGGLMFKFVFSNGTLKRYSAQGRDGHWSSDYLSFNYTMEKKRDSGGNNFVAISFGDGSDIDHAHQTIAFINHCLIAVWFIEGNPAGNLKYGDFKWNDDL